MSSNTTKHVLKPDGTVPDTGDIVVVPTSNVPNQGRFRIVTITKQFPKIEYIGVPIDQHDTQIGRTEAFTQDEITAVE